MTATLCSVRISDSHQGEHKNNRAVGQVTMVQFSGILGHPESIDHLVIEINK